MSSTWPRCNGAAVEVAADVRGLVDVEEAQTSVLTSGEARDSKRICRWFLTVPGLHMMPSSAYIATTLRESCWRASRSPSLTTPSLSLTTSCPGRSSSTEASSSLDLFTLLQSTFKTC